MKLFNKLFGAMDSFSETRLRKSARNIGRRHFLAKTGVLLVGTGVMPLLPFNRGMSNAYAAEKATTDDTDCSYWRYCALDGNLCTSSGGTVTTCPAGSEASRDSRVGTCLIPHDSKNYPASYSDCFGTATVRNYVTCSPRQGERPG